MKNLQNLLTLVLSFYFFMIFVNCQLCQSEKAEPQKDLIQTGTYTIVNQNYQKVQQNNLLYQNSYEIPLTYTPPALNSYFIAISTLQISSQQTSFLDFTLRTNKKQNSFTLMLVSSLNQWKSYTISYLITSRVDLKIGRILFNAFEQNGDSSIEKFQGNYKIQEWDNKKVLGENSNLIAKLFLSGARTISNKNLITPTSLFISSTTINSTSGEINFLIQNPFLATVITLEFNYILFQESEFKYNIQELSFQGSGITTKQSFQNSAFYIFGGLTGINSEKAMNNNFSVIAFYEISISCKGNKCKNACIPKRQCPINNGKIINEFKTNEYCLMECNENEVFNSLNQCVCSYGFQKRNGKCQQIILNLKCNTTQMINYTTRKCQCKDDYVLVGFNCEKKCNINGFMNGTKCQCLQGYREYKGFCHNCEQRIDEINKRCYCAEPQFYQVSNGSCIRTPCKSNLRYFVSENKCGCPGPNLVQVNGVCYQTCGINKYKTINKNCECLPGFTEVKEKNGCFKKVNCTKLNQIVDKSGYECLCKDGFQRDSQTQNCIFKCPIDETLTSNKSSCECNIGFKRDLQTKKCIEVLPNCGFNQIYDKNVFSCRCKDGFFRDQTMICTQKYGISCNQNQQFSSLSQSCTCIQGYQRNSQGFCQLFAKQKICPTNMILKNNQCQCPLGFTKSGQNCISICATNQLFNQKSSSCQCRQGYGKVNNFCKECPNNSVTKNNVCVCLMGLKWNTSTNTCQLDCPQNSIKRLYTLPENGTVYICQCLAAYKQNQVGKCQKIPDPVCPALPVQVPSISCPGSSTWDPTNYKCYCNSSSLFLINGTCKSCDLYQTWNGQSCVCQSGYNMINNKCLKCDVNSVFRGGKCNCNFGFYDQNQNNLENTSCKTCHSSCGTCYGPLDTQCLTCSDAQASLKDGRCSTSIICPKGSFNSSNTCKKCSQYCSRCKNQNQCTQCLPGFDVEQINILNTVTSFCAEVCGDGKRYEYECDDGNLIDGDGCDSGCFIEKGWVCSGGSPTKSSVCVNSLLVRSILTSTKPLRLFGEIAQGFTLSYIPDQLSENGCINCNDILLVKLISYAILPSIEIVYLPTTRFKFSVKFSFNGIFAIPDFVYSVQINPKYSKYFSVEDMAQKIIIPVIPADLAINNPQDTLSLDDMLIP